jgi:DsbC/DsbD-like thiol-disulfide interchange protein
MWRLCVLILAMFPIPLLAETAGHVRATMLTDFDFARPGKGFSEFHIGVLLEIDPGWHIYWQNPGEAGLATTVRFSVPSDFTLGETEYPVAEKFVQPGGVIGYGYTRSVLLMATVTPPRQIHLSGDEKVSARATWLCCEKVCIPGNTTVEVPLIRQRDNEKSRAVFDKWKKRIPAPLEKSTDPRGSLAASEMNGRGGDFEIKLQWEKQPAEIEVFPAPPEQVRVSAIKIERNESTARITFRAEVLPGQQLTQKVFPVVVGYQSRDREWRGVRLDCSLDSTKRK